MDNADERRCMPRCHKKFGEGFAVLTGDGLLNLAFETMTKACISSGTPNAVLAMDAIGNASGIFGMVNGQAVDLKLASKKDTTESELIALIEQKTMA
ncbi:MAG: polyprenyl synthetase family protein, partial [Clostridia bacterium]|nr:polyprenyl synthetase family protein [Clostridia bacterium]